jgi:hypothetical protein
MKKKFHMVNWSTVCAPKENGGLGIHDLEKINIALGEKILWRLVSDGNDWWKKAICNKYLSRNRKRSLGCSHNSTTRVSYLETTLRLPLAYKKPSLLEPREWKINQDLG